ncbi:MAG TPA: cation-translocating P-type ATPase [Polyangiaceae bacterium]|nr:cation-translocating P-type ATPase [Polyangiaceae bacterium]
MVDARDVNAGLTSEQARELRVRFGPNALPAKPPRPLVRRVLAQLKSALIYLLLFALVVDMVAWAIAGAVGAPLEAIAILCVILLNAALGVAQEYRSERALLELERLSAPRAWALRDDCFQRIDAAELVPGDVVRLEAGDRVPADGYVHGSETLSVDESVLTGEALPVDKADTDELLSGTLVTHGRAQLVIERTGPSSNMGRLAATLSSIDVSKTPLEQRVDELGTRIARVVAVLCLAMVLAGLALYGLSRPLPVLMFAVAFGVAVVPEGMPAMMTLALAFGVQRMARRQAVVRRLAAVEALGSVTVIATDKTGTLTLNQLTVEELQAADGHQADALCAMVLANDADLGSGAGDPLEIALVKYAERHGTDVHALTQAYPRISSRGFDSQWRCMRVTVIAPSGEQVAFLKGAPEAILARCVLSEAERHRLLGLADAAARRGSKVLGLARGTAEAERELTFLGLVSLGDPARPEARGAVLAARRAGVRVVMITGDHPATARAIAEAVGIDAKQVAQGSELSGNDAQVDALLASCNVFARMQPEHKLRLIERLQASGAVVAMTGDGLNDAPALKRADIGVAMGGRGSEVAREVADLVLLDDNFATIVAAIEEGRGIYANVQSFVRFSFSSNVALMVLVFGAAFGSLLMGLRSSDGSLLLPLTALQILWINFLGDGPPALALSLDRSKNALLEPPRSPHAPLLDGVGVRFVLSDGLVKGGLGLLLLVLLPLLGQSMVTTASAAFLYEGIAKLLSMFPARRLRGRLEPNHWVLAATAASVSLQLGCVLISPLRRVMGLAPLAAPDVTVVGLLLLATVALGELLLRLLRGSAEPHPALSS